MKKKVFFVSKNNSWSNFLFGKLSTLDNIALYGFNDEQFPLSIDIVQSDKPDYIFFFHWSKYISQEIFENYNCISFHTSNLPNGRGGTPIQNQILDGIIKTKVNAIKTCQEIDAGDIFCSEEITLQGSLYDIWHIISNVSFLMIKKIINTSLTSIRQTDLIRMTPIYQTDLTRTLYKRNNNNVIPFDTEKNIEGIYRFIQMMDAEKYKNSYIDIGNFRLSFSRAGIKNDNIIADVLITKKE